MHAYITAYLQGAQSLQFSFGRGIAKEPRFVKVQLELAQRARDHFAILHAELHAILEEGTFVYLHM